MGCENNALSYYKNEGGFVMARINDPNVIGAGDIDTRAIDFLIDHGEDFANVRHNDSDFLSSDLFSYATIHGFEDRALDFAGEFKNFKLSKEFEEIGVEELDIELGSKLGVFYEVVQKSLDNGWEFGFHRHDKEHSDVVTDRMLRIVRQLGFGEEVEKIAVICGRMHDLGQIFSRKKHPEYSVKMIRTLLHGFLNEDQMRLLEDVIVNHEQENAKGLFYVAVEKADGDFGKAYEDLKNNNPLLWALILADKSDIGRDRVSQKALNRYAEAVKEDRYIRKDALVESEELDGDEHNIIFDRGNFRDNFGERMTFAEWRNLLLDLHGSRFALSAISHFVLNPNSDNFYINLINGEGSNSPRRIVFERGADPFVTIQSEIKKIEKADIAEKCLHFKAFGEQIIKEALGIEVSPNVNCEVEHFASGAFSSIYRVTWNDPNIPSFVVKTMSHRPDVPFDDIGQYFLHLKKDSRDLPGLVKNYGVYGLTASEIINLDSIDILPDDVSVVFAVQEAMPKEAIQMLRVLNGLGLKTIQDGRVHETNMDSEISIEEAYEKIIQKIVEIHNLDGDMKQEEYRTSLMAIIEDNTRFDGVASCLPGIGVIVDKKNLDLLRSNMVELVNDYTNRYGKTRLKYVHGDAWASNFFVSGNEVFIIDPGDVKKSDTALDVTFATADIAFIGINKQGLIPDHNERNFQYLEYADRLIDRYKELSGDEDVRKTMAIFFGFKGFVSAVFDAGENNDQRNDLIAACIGVTELASKNEDFEFRFCNLKQYSEYGKELMAR